MKKPKVRMLPWMTAIYDASFTQRLKGLPYIDIQAVPPPEVSAFFWT